MAVDQRTKFKPKVKGHGPKRKALTPPTEDALPVKTQGKWRDDLSFRLYDLFRNGATVATAAGVLGVRQETLAGWLEKVPMARLAKDTADAQRKAESGTFADYVYSQLPADIKPIWDELVTLDKLEGGLSMKAVERLLDGHGKRGRQYVFLQAVIYKSFNVTAALAFAGITRRTYELWMQNDADFAELVNYFQVAKKDLGEGRLWELVNSGDQAAVLFVNRTLNRDRGFGDTKSIKIDQTHTHRLLIDIDELDLPLEIRTAILEAHRRKQAIANGDDDVSPVALPAVRRPLLIDDIVEENES